MKRIALIALLALTAGGATAQTLNVVVGKVIYQVPADEAGDMFCNDNAVTILGKTFDVSEVDEMYIDNAEVEDNSVAVTYAGEEASVVVAGNCMRYLSVYVSKANVLIEQADDLSEELTYTLTGYSSDGSFYMNGSLKATVELNSLSLTSSSTAPINIRNGKRIKLLLYGNNTLSDSSASDGKGALMVNGHSELEGDGTLNLYGYARHAYWADEYIQIKKSFTGSINILHAESDGINVNQYYEQNGGTVSISNVGDEGIQVSADDDAGSVTIAGGELTIAVTANGSKGIKAEGDIIVNQEKSMPYITISNSGDAYYDSSESDIKGVVCISTDTNMTIDAGVISLSATGTGGKGIKADNIFTINDGSLTISTSGSRYTYNRDTSSPKGIRAGTKATTTRGNPTGDLLINGGEINISVSGQGEGSEGIESKNTLTINGGNIVVNAYDDAINSAKNMYIYGGDIQTISSTNDALDANASIYIYDGTIMALASIETSLDAAEGYDVYINGGTIFGVGSMTFTPASSSAQAYISTTGTVSANTTIALSSGSTTLCSFTIPAEYTAMGGNVGGDTSMGGDMGNTGPGSSGSTGPGSSGSSGNSGPGSSGGMGDTGMGDTGMGDTGMGGITSGYQLLMSCPSLRSGSSYTLTNGSSTSTVTAR